MSILSGCWSGDYGNGTLAGAGQRRQQAMRQPGTWSVVRGSWFSSAKWRKPVDEGGHFRAGCFLDASDADVDDD